MYKNGEKKYDSMDKKSIFMIKNFKLPISYNKTKLENSFTPIIYRVKRGKSDKLSLGAFN